MKNATRNVIESLPVLKGHLINKGDDKLNPEEIEGFNQIEKTFLKLVCFFEEPEKYEFQLQDLYKNLDDEWLVLALDSINLFFKNDTYLLKNVTHSFTKDSGDYFNQKDFVDYLNENGQNYSEAKMSVYIQREIIPSPDLVLSDTRYWLKSTCEKFLNKIKNNKKGANYNV